MASTIRHLNALHAFEVAARHSSLAKAADELNVSPSVVSQHVKNLELWLGVDLFTRYGNRVELTVDGRELQPQLSTAFQMLTDACDGLLRISQKTTLTIIAEPALASLWLRKRISDFCEQFQSIDIELRPAWQLPDLESGHADILIHFEIRAPEKNVKQLRLFPIDGFPACAPERKRQIDESGNALDWLNAPLVHDNGREIWQHWFSEHEPKNQAWREGRVYSDLSLAIDAAIDSEGVVLADDILCKKELEAGTLVRCDSRHVRCAWYTAVIPNDMHNNSARSTFLSWLTDTIRDEGILTDL